MAEPYSDYGINHLGWVVDDIAATSARLESSGFREGHPGEDQPFGRRRYYLDSAGFEWEPVQYLSDRPEERNRYG